jgi:inhibitor of cysteine peptidase
MKRVKWYLVLLLVGALLLVGGCAEEPSPLVVPDTIPIPSAEDADVFIPIGEFQSQPHIDVVMNTVLGGELTVVLGSNPTTGYQWSENAEISDESVIKQVSHGFVEPGIDEPPGTPGEEAWTFKALERGTVTIFLEYSRPWVEEDALHWTVTITTTIQ